MNKNYIIIGLVVALAGAGIYLFSTGNIPVAGNQLTRAKAEQMIWEKVKDQHATISAFATFNEGYGPAKYYFDSEKEEMLNKLETDGLIKVKGKVMGGGTIIDFTDKAQQYLLPDSDSTRKVILLAKIKNIKVTGLTEPSDDKGVKTITANYTKYYDNNMTPFSILGDMFGVSVSSEGLSKGVETQATFVLYDDGWRIQ